jgi:serine/threonine-protein kinase
LDIETYLSGFDKAEKINKGMARDDKYRCRRGREEYLLRVADGEDFAEKRNEFEHLKRLSEAGLPVPKCVELVKNDDGSKVFTLLSWVTGEDLEGVISIISASEQYEIGKQAGSILRRIHETCPETGTEKNWYDRYAETINPRLDAYRNEGVPFAGFEKILKYFDANKHLLRERPMCHHHGDYHTGNLIIDSGKVWVIDWHTMDFESFGDPWYEFNRLDTKYPEFAKGQIDGYFNENIPEEFWRLFALYISVSAITSIVWAKYFAPDELDNILRLNKSILTIFDDMENPVPKWYR